MPRFFSIRVLVCWLALAAASQAQQYVFRAYRQADGLKNLAINGLARDREGFLWVATQNGVYRFIGSGFQQFGPEEGIGELDVRNIVADPAGTIWVATAENVYRWDGQRFQPAGRDRIPVAGTHRMVVEDPGHLLIVDDRRLYRLEHNAGGGMLSFLPVFTARQVGALPGLGQVFSVSIVNPSSGGSRVWVGCGKKLCTWLDGELDSATQSTLRSRDGAVTEWGEDRGLLPDDYQSVLMDRSGTLWAAGRRHVMALPRGATRFVDRGLPGTDSVNFYGHAPLVQDREGRVLVPAEDGVARWTGVGWQMIGRANGLLHISHVMGLDFDASGDLWIGTLGDGLYNWSGYEDWEGWSDQQGLPSAAVWMTVPSRSGRVYVGTEKGPAWVDPHSGAAGPLSASSQWAFGELGAMGFERDGSLWAGTFSGAILRIDPATGHTVQTAKLPGLINSAFEDSTGNVFFATNEDLWVRESRSAPHRIDAVDALLGDSARIEAGCGMADGQAYFLTGNRLLRLHGGQWTLPPIDGMSKLHGSLIALSCAADGAVWVTGQQTGTWRLTPGVERMQAWQLQPPAELRSSATLSILVDHRGWVWQGTDLGLLAWNGHAWRHLTQESGLLWNDVNQGALREGSDGSVWIGTSGGVAHLLHPERVFDPAPVAVSITEIRHGNDLYTGAQEIVLPWPGTPLHFQVASPAARNRSELNIEIWMVGLQRDWIKTFNGIATFSNLPPGDYTFMAMATNPSLSAYSEVVKVQVRILPPWWKTWWFYALCALALVLLVAGAAQLFARHLRQRAKDLEILVRQRTQELEASREQLRIQATHDGLTGLLNRVAVLSALEAEMDRAKRERRTLVVALADLDNFKRVNDTHGHLAGDNALRTFASAVLAAIRAYDHAGRYGGEEFLLIVNEIPREATEQRLVSLHASISNLHISAQGKEFKITCSMGATVFDPADGPRSVESLLAFADVALYEAKAAGRNRVVFRKSVELDAGDQTPSA